MSASLSNQEIEDKYFLLGKMEILTLLNDLAHRREPVSVYFNGGQDFILSMLLSAKPDGLVFDMGGDDKANARLEKSDQCVFLAEPDGIRVQFSAIEPKRFWWGDEEAFWVPLPERIVRMQRRDSYRNELPVVNTIKVKLSDENGANLGDWPLHNLSVGGLGANVVGEPHINIGDSIAHVVIWISEKKRLDCVGVVRHISVIDRQGKGRYRVGIEFKDLPHAMEVAIQRYIIKIEFERRKLLAK
jgi:c-di-GMP-binding flagellar brake protein YcgR